MTEEEGKVKKNKIAPGSIQLQTAGDLLLARCQNRDLNQLFRRYEALLESFANMEREERLINYRFLLGLILTSHAKKTKDITERKKIFDLKNAVYFDLANNRDFRRKLAFRYLISKNFRVISFCDRCQQQNEGENTPKHRWKFCRSCKVDRKFYNVLSMHHKFDNGSATLFLSNDLITEVENAKLNQKGRIDDFKEEARYDKFHYNIKNLDVFDLESVRAVHSKFIKSSS